MVIDGAHTVERFNSTVKSYIQARLDVMVREQQATSERLQRYEVLNEALTKSIDQANLELSKSAASVARSEAEAVFYKDKSKLLEETNCKVIAIDQDPSVQVKAEEFKKRYGERFNFFEEKF